MANQIAAEDLEKAVALLVDLKSKVNDVSSHIQNLIKKVDEGEISTAKGVSFLEVKYQTLLSYLVNLTHLVTQKVGGQSIEGAPDIERLVEIRTVLEKMKPIDQKLKYQIDKLVRTVTTGTLDANDPLRLKANPDNLVSKLEESESEDSGSEGVKSSKPYRPPKLAAVHYEGDETVQDRREKQMDKAKKRALSSSIMKDLRAEYDEGPEEIRESTLHRSRSTKTHTERAEYEEKYFVRMSLSKKERNSEKQSHTQSGLDGLTRFGDISALTGGGETLGEEDGIPGKKRKRSSGKYKSKGKKGFKKRRK